MLQYQGYPKPVRAENEGTALGQRHAGLDRVFHLAELPLEQKENS